MIITCPSCQTQYDVPDSAFGPAGRTVQCARCHEKWHAQTESAQTEHEDPPEPESNADEVGDGAADTEMETAYEVEGYDDIDFRSLDEVDPIDDDLGSLTGLDVEAAYGDKPARQRFRLGKSTPRVVVRKKPAQNGPPAHLWLVGGAIATAAVGFWLREPIVGMVPQAAAIYELVGVPVNLVGLDFADITWERATENGFDVLIVRGKIVNTSKKGAYVPAVRLALVDADKRELFSWITETETRALAPGDLAQFEARLASPPQDADNLVVRFASRSG